MLIAIKKETRVELLIKVILLVDFTARRQWSLDRRTSQLTNVVLTKFLPAISKNFQKREGRKKNSGVELNVGGEGGGE